MKPRFQDTIENVSIIMEHPEIRHLFTDAKSPDAIYEILHQLLEGDAPETASLAFNRICRDFGYKRVIQCINTLCPSSKRHWPA